MHYYSWHVRDYISKTRHLTLMEDLAYRRLLDLYYMEECLLGVPNTLARKIGMPDEEEVVADVLVEFFDSDDDEKCPKWSNPRADAEIRKFREKSEKASAAGKASAVQRTFNARSTPVQRTSNARQLTNNQEPVPSTQEPEVQKKRAAARPDDVSEEVWRDWLQHRKALKATVTDTVLNRLRSESETANMPLESVLALCCANGWRGFQAHWVGDRRSNGRTGAQAEEHPRGMPVPYTDPITGKRCGCPVCKTKETDHDK